MSTPTPAQAFPPAEFIREELEARGWSVEEFATNADISVDEAKQILAGRILLPRDARALSTAFDVTPVFWMNLQASFHQWSLAQTQIRQRLEGSR